MRIGLDARLIQNSGIGTTIRGLIEHWSPSQQQQVLLYTETGWTNPYGMQQVSVAERFYGLRQHWSYGRRLNREPIDLFHMPHFDVPLSYRGRLVVTVHDLIHYLKPEYSTKPFTKIYSYWLLRFVARRANRIICVSESTKNDFLNLFPTAADRVRVISPAVTPPAPVSEEIRRHVRTHYNLEPGYILYIGNLRHSKNTLGLVAAYEQLLKNRPDTPPLVLAGHNSLPDLINAKRLQNVRLLGAVPFEHLSALYADALCFAFPSFYEGFGLPPLEAMAHGVPVLTSDRASLPEVCGDAALYVNPDSVDDIARGLQRMMSEPENRSRLRQAGFENIKRFSWQTFADKTWQLYEDVVKESAL